MDDIERAAVAAEGYDPDDSTMAPLDAGLCIPAHTLRQLRQSGGVKSCSRSERAEIVAPSIYCGAADAGEPVTRAVVVRRLEQLAAHRSTCPCGRCEWLHSGQQRPATLRVDDVWRIVRSWERWTSSPGSGRIRAY